MVRSPITLALTAASVVGFLTTYPYVATAIAYRGRDNGLAYILLVLGVGVWNAMSAAQVLTARPLVQTFFLALAVVGALLAGLGWFLFAGTASSTSGVPNRRLLYGGAGVDISLVVTVPVHEFYWTTVSSSTASSAFAVIDPVVGYWAHTLLLALLFGTGTVLFGGAWRAGTGLPYTRAYTLAGLATVVAIVGSNVLAPGGLSVAPLAAVSLTTIGWVQARRGRVLRRLRALVG